MPLSRRDITFTAALCLSLLAHGLIVGTAAEVYSRRLSAGMHLPGWVINSSDDQTEEKTDPRNRLGDPDGQGKAILASVGELPMQARLGFQDQPLLSHDPVSLGVSGNESTESATPPKPADEPAKPAPVAPAVEHPPTPFGMPIPPGEFDEPFAIKPSPEVAVSVPPPPEPTPSEPAPAPAAASPRPTTVAAVPAPQGESDSDAISTVGSAVFRTGSTDVRLGRKHKLIRPHLSLAAEADLRVMPNPTVVLKLKLDSAGNVTSASVFRSSGSSHVDQPCVLAAYRWWFEPFKDPSGKPMNDVITFSIRFF